MPVKLFELKLVKSIFLLMWCGFTKCLDTVYMVSYTLEATVCLVWCKTAMFGATFNLVTSVGVP